MGLFKKRGLGILKIIGIILFSALALFLLFRGIVNENIISGV